MAFPVLSQFYYVCFLLKEELSKYEERFLDPYLIFEKLISGIFYLLVYLQQQLVRSYLADTPPPLPTLLFRWKPPEALPYTYLW